MKEKRIGGNTSTGRALEKKNLESEKTKLINEIKRLEDIKNKTADQNSALHICKTRFRNTVENLKSYE